MRFSCRNSSECTAFLPTPRSTRRSGSSLQPRQSSVITPLLLAGAEVQPARAGVSVGVDVHSPTATTAANAAAVNRLVFPRAHTEGVFTPPAAAPVPPVDARVEKMGTKKMKKMKKMKQVVKRKRAVVNSSKPPTPNAPLAKRRKVSMVDDAASAGASAIEAEDLQRRTAAVAVLRAMSQCVHGGGGFQETLQQEQQQQPQPQLTTGAAYSPIETVTSPASSAPVAPLQPVLRPVPASAITTATTTATTLTSTAATPTITTPEAATSASAAPSIPVAQLLSFSAPVDKQHLTVHRPPLKDGDHSSTPARQQSRTGSKRRKTQSQKLRADMPMVGL